MFYAIQECNGARYFFSGANGNKEDYTTMEELLQEIELWKQRVTPSIAQSTNFDIRHD